MLNICLVERSGNNNHEIELEYEEFRHTMSITAAKIDD